MRLEHCKFLLTYHQGIKSAIFTSDKRYRFAVFAGKIGCLHWQNMQPQVGLKMTRLGVRVADVMRGEADKRKLQESGCQAGLVQKHYEK